MSLGAHLKEFRRRLIISLIAIVLAGIIGWWASGWVFVSLQAPITQVAEASGRHVTLDFDTLGVSFDLTLQIALTIAVLIASPVWLYQVWAFVTPGLVRKERRYAIGFLAAAIPLFLVGCALGFFAMPRMVDLMLSFAPTESVSNLSARYYYDFFLKLILVSGVACVLPVILVVLNFAGVMRGVTILRGWRVALLVIVIFTAIATPASDIVSMLILAVPMLVLYFLAAGLALWNDRIRRKRAERVLHEEPVPLDSIDVDPGSEPV